MLLQHQQTLESAVPVCKNEGSALRGASRAARVTQARKTSKIGSKIDLKSLKIASRGRSGALVGQLFGVRVCLACEIERRAGSNGVRTASSLGRDAFELAWWQKIPPTAAITSDRSEPPAGTLG